ncbi:DUF2059 domain-containing protein [Kaistia dalseonensis]|uniref:DUF2059 domain-containing protein n=1 Tax=Kaistia dalseonensis TaxID=410840 RepID=A0ABU0H3F2_9HYPH|nr:DUF2059 domain-containing protein [Kaistia dalseonensis]MCX5494237.1 DUF2059 domain-containing protein [Kaistia dalseonensis]MDQ0436817.1 hypothetical protein [Kaistia dalseonensis]
MTFIRSSIRAVALAVGLAIGIAGVARAQEITEAHLAAALDAVVAAKTSRGFDNLLPLLSQQTQNKLIRMRPDQHQAISQVVDAEALELVSRRKDLDNDVARIWAKYFTEDELNAIATFYKSPAGSKLADIGPKVVGETLQSVKGWSDRVGEELYEKSREELKKKGIEF